MNMNINDIKAALVGALQNWKSRNNREMASTAERLHFLLKTVFSLTKASDKFS